MVIVACPFIILLISRSLLFFSLFSVLNKLSNFSSPHLLLFPQMHTNTPTNKHIHIDKSTQRYTCSKKKKKNTNTQTHPHTNKPTRTNNKETNWCLIGTIGAWLEQLELVGMGLAWSELGRSGRCLWIGAREISVKSDMVRSNRCLWIGAREIDALSGLAWSELWIDACDRDDVN